jgi:hypothetical protein
MEISRRKKNWSQVPDGCLTPGQTGRLIIGRKLNLPSECKFGKKKKDLWSKVPDWA